VASRRHDLSSTVDLSNEQSSLDEPRVWRGKRMDLFFLLAPDWFFAPTKAQLKAEGTKTHPMSLPRPIPGSAMLHNH
jgi:hypothetical protein